MKPRLTEQDFVQAADRLGCKLASIKAVAAVESRGSGFLPTGEPVILFERHWMHRRMRSYGLTPPTNSPVVQMSAGGYLGGQKEHQRLQQAVAIHRESALESCSWGMFQIMGFHWQALGYPSLQAFVNAMYKDEQSHLEAFIRFIEADKRLHRAIKSEDWLTFATAYNGPAQAKNNYAPKLKAEFEKLSRG